MTAPLRCARCRRPVLIEWRRSGPSRVPLRAFRCPHCKRALYQRKEARG